MGDDRLASTLPALRTAGDSGDGASRKGNSAASDEVLAVAGPELVEHWIEVQIESMRESQRVQDMAWQQARVWHAGLQRAIDIRRRRNIRLVFPKIGEGMFLVPPLWAVTEGEVLVGFALIEEL